jgi:oxygen-independent coproporphyrinogen III oxidase
MKTRIKKYAVPAPRYTSYPTVPFWDTSTPDGLRWQHSVKLAAAPGNGISIYIHLPFCESLCTYCGCHTRITRNHGVETPYIDAVLSEWAIYRRDLGERPVIRELHLGGGTPTFFSPENLQRLIKGILDGCEVPGDANFGFEGHPVNTSRKHLEILAHHGFKRLSLGVQDFDPRVQEIINRRQTPGQVEAVTRNARQLGYTSVNYDLIYGLPLQTPGGLQRTLSQALEFRPDRLAFYSYAHVPWMKPGQRKFTDADPPSPDKKQELYELGRDILLNAGYREIGMDHFALPSDSLFAAEASGTLHRNFMGYTEQHTRLLVGLGVSAISDSGTAFAQNTKKLEEYLSIGKTGELALVKMHAVTREDQLVREHILNLMCRQETNWSGNDPLENLLLGDACQRLLPLQHDGLTALGDRCIRVTPTGRRFLRNICMMLDARLWTKPAGDQRFSMAG